MTGEPRTHQISTAPSKLIPGARTFGSKLAIQGRYNQSQALGGLLCSLHGIAVRPLAFTAGHGTNRQHRLTLALFEIRGQPIRREGTKSVTDNRQIKERRAASNLSDRTVLTNSLLVLDSSRKQCYTRFRE
jgi:hypothetical protein